MQSRITAVIGFHALNCRVIDFLDRHGRTLDLNIIRNMSEDILSDMIQNLFTDERFKHYDFNLKVDMRYKTRLAEDLGDRQIFEIEFDTAFFNSYIARSLRVLRDALEGWANELIQEFVAPNSMMRTKITKKDT